MKDDRDVVQQRTESYDHYAEYEYHLCHDVMLPHFRQWGITLKGKRVIDVGCGAGGLAEVMHEQGATVSGIDISEERIQVARKRARRRNISIDYRVGDAHLPDPSLRGVFDLVVLRDVIEHVKNPRFFLRQVSRFCSPEGLIYLSFPPWFSVFGGHQHHPRAITRFIPWIHLLPGRPYLALLPNIDEYRREVRSLNRLTIAQLEYFIAEDEYQVVKRDMFIIRPSLRFKYGLPTIRAGAFFSRRGWREFFVTGAFYLLKP